MRKTAPFLAVLLAVGPALAQSPPSPPVTPPPPPPSPPSPSPQSLVSLPDPAYAEVKPAQQHALRPRITKIIYPTMGLPALAPSSGSFDVWVRGAWSTDAQAWRVVLSTDETPALGPWIELRPATVEMDRAAGVTKLHVGLPATAVRDVYDLKIFGPAGITDGQPRAVRVTGTPRSEYRFAFMSDHQLWDPSWKVGGPNERNAGDYPQRGERDRNRAAARQGWHELELLDPDFVLYGGDLVFGLDYPSETEESYRLWSKNRFATFFVPGNHDGYARYEVRLKGGMSTAVASLMRCKDKLSGDLSWEKVAGYVGCAYGDVRGYLFHKLVEDGLAYYQTMMGPPYYSFDYGELHFVGLNTYGGTPERRHSFSIYVDLFDLHLGAPAVDNYGGYLTDGTLAWLEDDMKRAQQAGKTIVVFGHHDPRGNREQVPERRYHHNNPFPTDPISLEGFQEWNYESAVWDSDPTDQRRIESPSEHSGTRLCRLLARYASYVFLGHRHADDHTVYEPGDELAPGIRAERRIEWVRVTSAAGAPHEGAYWGYRVFQVHEGHLLDTKDYDNARGLGALPEGNFWVEQGATPAPHAATGAGAGASPIGVLEVVNGLPHPIALQLRLRLPASVGGWRFVDTGSNTELALREVAALDGGGALYYVGIDAPPGNTFPPVPGGEVRRVVMAQPKSGNRPPEARIVVVPDPPVAGTKVVLSAASSSDPDGDPIIDYRWGLPGGSQIGKEARVSFPAAGSYLVAVDVYDSYGALGHAERMVTVNAPPQVAAVIHPPLAVHANGCGCAVGGRDREWDGSDGGRGGVALGGTIALAIVAGLRRRRRRGGA